MCPVVGGGEQPRQPSLGYHYFRQSFEHILLVMFAVEITNETRMCRPADITVYFPHSPASFRGAK